MKRLFATLLTFSLLLPTTAAQARDVPVDRQVDLDTFYLAVACGTEVGDAGCRAGKRYFGNSRQPKVTIAIKRVQEGYPEAEAARMEQALIQAVEELNAAGSGLRLSVVPARKYSNISIYLVNQRRNTWVERNALPGLAGDDLRTNWMRYWYSRNRIKEVDVLVSNDISRNGAKTFLMSHILGGLGLIHDVTGSAYAGKSIFHDTRRSSGLTELDKAVIQRHYPARR